ncbi:MAG TPA: hypothetical protein VFZ72_05240, partial [Jiangellaceae bacterium]
RSARRRSRSSARRARRSCGCGGVEQPDPGGEFGGDVDDVLASLKQPLGQRAAGTVGASTAQTRSGQDFAKVRIAT